MLRTIGMFLLGIFLLFCGMGMIEMAITDPDFNIASTIFAIICGLLFVAGGVAIAGTIVMDGRSVKKKKKKTDVVADIAEELKSTVCPGYYKILEDKNDTERLLHYFRVDYASFFDQDGIAENAAIVKEATQVYWHILYLQKNRLDQKGIRLKFTSDRFSYGDVAAIRKKSYFDKKYKVTDVSETIEAKTEFLDGQGKRLHQRKNLQTACYQILSAEYVSAKKVICPNCGKDATREDLIDGCDYCGTKFTVEDLNNRVSEFSFRKDYDVEYSKYKEKRKTYIPRVALISGIPAFLFCLINVIRIFADMEGPYTLRVAGAMFAIAFPTAAFVFIAVYAFIIFVFPLLQGVASFSYMSKRMISKMKNIQEANMEVAKNIQKTDPLFSLDAFYSSLHNKLSAIHFASGPAEASAFVEGANSEAQVAAVMPSYQDLIDLQVEEIHLDGYSVGEYTQEMNVTVKLSLLSEKKGSVSRKKEKLKMTLVKDSNCKSQTVCAPSFTNCKQCGSPMSLLAGRVCSYCGHARRLAEYDWAIRSYKKVV